MLQHYLRPIRKPYSPSFLRIHRLAPLDRGHDPEALIGESVKNLENKVSELGADNVAAFFCEPIIGSGGVLVPPVGWLKAMSDTCKRLGILLVVDEVITGFGRTTKSCNHLIHYQ